MKYRKIIRATPHNYKRITEDKNQAFHQEMESMTVLESVELALITKKVVQEVAKERIHEMKPSLLRQITMKYKYK